MRPKMKGGSWSLFERNFTTRTSTTPGELLAMCLCFEGSSDNTMTQSRLLRVGPDEWTVFDVRPEPAGVANPALSNGWLCFEYIEKRRRLAPIPIGWHDLAEPDLVTLWERATPVARATIQSPSADHFHVKGLPAGDPARARRLR
jgi:hypothetical protein